MKIIPYKVCTGKENMEIDRKLLEDAINSQTKEPVFRLYGWAPKCISLGRNQKSDFLNHKILKHENIDVVTRLTGGRALLHDKEITYSFVCPCDYLKNGENITQSYIEISQILIHGLKKIGIELEFGSEKVQTKFDYCMLVSTGADLCFKGKKLIGSAQCRKNGYILQHGSILYDYDKELLEKIFNENVDRLTSIKEINPSLSLQDVISAFHSVQI